MKGRAVLVMVGAAIAFSSAPQITWAAQSCTEPSNCAAVSLDVVRSGTLKPGDTFGVNLGFAQGPDAGQLGGIGKLAALALTIGIPGSGSDTPLQLANDCALDADGLPTAVVPDPSISNFKVVVENASCANGRLHCLCPDAGQPRDNFINLVIYGPNPLPTPGAGGIEIPTLPVGPQTLLTINLQIGPTASGTIPLHVFNEVTDFQTTRPQFTALLSVGDKQAVDQTCVPVSGQPPCSSAEDVSQMVFTDTSVEVVTPVTCIGDLNGDSSITANEVVLTIKAFAQDDVSLNPAADGDNSGSVEAGEVVRVINNFARDECNP